MIYLKLPGPGTQTTVQAKFQFRGLDETNQLYAGYIVHNHTHTDEISAIIATHRAGPRAALTSPVLE